MMSLILLTSDTVFMLMTLTVNGACDQGNLDTLRDS